MDTEAQSTERDRSPHPAGPEDTSGTPGPEGRSRSALAGHPVGWLPGGRITAALLLLALSTFVAQPFQIPSGSMEPALRAGDRVLVLKLAYRFGAEPQRGDVVVFDGTEYFGDADYIKRVVGVGGDRVVCCDKDGRIRVNGRTVDESGFLFPGESASTVPFDVAVPEDRLFVLGDHRGSSSDSRDHLGSPGGGMIPVSRVIGRADWIVQPFGRATRLHRPDAYARVPAPAPAPAQVPAARANAAHLGEGTHG
ncbi:signal peptidase I [Streptomyces hirsutus]|uniref:signal peptidase I n=1 Tax=Streptomyces hirsutus TaxID=35620 RepID=UPI0036326A13